ncbi:PilT protein-like protein [[Synechococcus] sp. NIES-970]|nr:PilT protein-like protein [[Synechococcus] sp. NIES-970]
MKLGISLVDLVEYEAQRNDMEILQINSEHLEKSSQLPFYHKDLFDKLIIAQSIAKDMSTITKDSCFLDYSTTVI